jgi:HEPN domain-containing protein
VKNETEEWVKIADHDVGSAAALLQQEFLQGAAYFCQQALEKLLKGLLVEAGLAPPWTHDLVELVDLASLKVSAAKREFLTRLTDHAARSRYPGAEYNEDDVQTLLEETQRMFRWLRAKLT